MAGEEEEGDINRRNRPTPRPPKSFISPVVGIESNTFNTGHPKFALQFKTSRRNVANFIQRTLSDEGHAVAKTIKTGEIQTIPRPAAVPNGTDEEKAAERDENILRDAMMAAIGKRIVKLQGDIKKGFAIVYDQCSEAVKSQLKTTENWETIEDDQSLHLLIKVIQKICMGHDDTNQDMYNVVQACKNMFLFQQNDETSTEDYVRDFKSYWDTCEAYQTEPSNHPKLIEVSVEDIRAGTTATSAEKTKAKLEIKEEFMAGLLTSSANQKWFGLLKRDLQNLYLKGQDDYPRRLRMQRGS